MDRTLETEEKVIVRGLKPEDLQRVISLDAKNSGRQREEFFKVKLQQNLQETGIKVSLAAESDGCFCGFLLARVFYGEFGALEATAVLDTIDVDPGFQGQGVGRALLDQLCANLSGLGVGKLRTEVEWGTGDLVAFFQREGFTPAPRICLDLDVAARPRRDQRMGE
ncbi:GNAT family N-acetyltransferase [bacterium]|nr:GNAT family N-acetyltransferase [bacterium]